MRLTENIYLVGSGKFGFALSNMVDCNIYLVDTGEGFVLIDSGCGMDNGRIEKIITSHGFALSELKAIFLTHYHADHACGAEYFHQKSGCRVLIAESECRAVREGDEYATSLIGAKGHAYPSDYSYTACPAAEGLADGETVTFGRVSFTARYVPGHSLCDMVLTVEIDSRSCLFSGDAVFANGEILLQSLYDVSVKPYYDAVAALSQQHFDALFPGHGLFVLSHADWHIKKCFQGFADGFVPKQLHFFN